MYSAPVTMTVTAFSSLLDLSTNWGVVGSATPGSWGSTPTTPIQDIPFWTTSTAGVYVAYGTVRTGEIKFRLDNAWTTNYGGPGIEWYTCSRWFQYSYHRWNLQIYSEHQQYDLHRSSLYLGNRR
jgi:hypothetical protein